MGPTEKSWLDCCSNFRRKVLRAKYAIVPVRLPRRCLVVVNATNEREMTEYRRTKSAIRKVMEVNSSGPRTLPVAAYMLANNETNSDGISFDSETGDTEIADCRDESPRLKAELVRGV